MASAEGWSLGVVALAALAPTALLMVQTPPAGATAIETQVLPVGEFDRVHFSGSGTVRLSQGDSAELVVRGHAAVLEQLEVETRDGALYIETAPSARHLVVELRVARLVEFVSEGEGRIVGDDLNFDVLTLEGSGAGSFDMQRLEARELAVRGHGATRFDLTGQVDTHVVELSGTGSYLAGQLISDCVSLHVAGASDVHLWADDMLDVEVAGSASIHYAGSPRVEQRVSGIARVERVPSMAF